MVKLKSVKENLKLLRSNPNIKHIIENRRYLAPNTVTVANLFCGILAIIYSTSNRFDQAVAAIGFAILLDGLDGRVARKFKATSSFGMEFDSFSDLISFGLAPAILMYNWAFLPNGDEFGVFLAFIYTVCTATRLARFNVASKSLAVFCGLPSPGAAGVVASIVHFNPTKYSNFPLLVMFSIIMLTTSFLMVSTISYFSPKSIKVTGVKSTFLPLLTAAIIGLIWYDHRLGLLILGCGYGLSGPITHFVRRRRKNISANQ